MTTLSQIGGIFALLTLLHFVADWLFQSHDEAMAKPTDAMIRARHCFIYAGIMTFTIWLAVRPEWYVALLSFYILWASHFAEDTYIPVYLWARYVRRPPEMREKAGIPEFKMFAETTLGKILLITVDQIIHLVFLIPVAIMLVVPQAVGLTFVTALAMALVLQFAHLYVTRNP